MKKNYFLKSVVMMLTITFGLVATEVSAQNYSILGNLTTTTGNSTANTGPSLYGCFYTENRNQILYLASDLQALGMSGSILSIGWNLANTGGMSSFQGFTISIKHTNTTSLGSSWETGLTQVYSGTVTPTTGWNQYTFTQPFAWDGVSNVLVQVCWDNGTINYQSPNGNMYYTATTYNSNNHEYSDTQVGCSLSSVNSFTKNYRPDTRFETTPPYANDAGINALINPSFPTCAMDSNVQVSLFNGGTANLTSATINWSVNGTLQTPVTYSGNLPSFSNDTVTLGVVTGGLMDGDVIVAWSSNPNSVPDSANFNDTLSVQVYNSLSGTYTIDPTAGQGDFNSFTDAVNAMASYGICGPTTFEAVDTTFLEQIELSTYTGMSDTNTVTFTSQSGNAAGVVLGYSSANSGDNYVVNFTTGSHYRFENMTIRNNGTTYSRVVTTPTSGGSFDNQFRGCILENSPSTSTSTFRAVAYVYGTGNDNWVFEDNMFINGSYGLYLYGNFSSNNMNNIVKGNTMMNNYYRGAYYYYQQDGMFSDNTTYSNATYSFATGFYMGQLRNTEVSNNLVQGSSTWPRYGIYMVTAQGDLQTFMPVYNNRVILQATNALYGIYISNNLFVEYAHNSVYMAGTSTSSYACYFTSGSYNILKNNIIQHMGAGYGIYLNGTGIYQSDYNNISVPNGNAGFAGGAQATLMDWQMATGFDSNSIVVNNVISDTATFKVCNDSLYAMGTPLSAYPYDMDGDMRDNPPCIGADEFLPISMFGFNTNPVLCAGDTLTLVQDYFDTVVWNTTDTSNVYQVTAPGTQTVSVYDLCGSDTSVFTVDPQTFAHIGDTNLCEGTMATLETGISGGTYMWSNGSTDSTIMVDSAQVVSVDVIDAFGCESSDTAFVTQSFDVVLPDSTTFCEGSSVVLDANMQGTYLWSDGSTNQTLAVSSSGTYSVTVTDQNCVSSSTSNVTEILDAIPSFTDSSSFLTVIFTNTSQNATNYLWDFGDGNTSIQENPTHIYPWTGADSLNYTVTLTAFNSCGQDDFINDGVRVGQLVSVSDIDFASQISVFPNPSNGQFNVSLQTPDAGDLEIMVVDVTGTLVYNQSFGLVNGDINREINLENAASGIYFVQVTLGDETAVFRVTVE